ncbi:hypothetical protein HCN83_17675 [Bacillus luteus]|uniref:Uncharacterized protein n=1 Tax=Alkalicoccus luteus TaxID=1237094 RepID=A0A969PTU8_9BACI|nr:hypothetical protein [Alkalicoccus luteus]
MRIMEEAAWENPHDRRVNRTAWWQAEVDAFLASGEQANVWCQSRGYHRGTFHKYRVRLDPTYQPTDPIDTWSTVTLDLGASLTLTCQGVQIDVPAGFDKELLKEVVEVLQDVEHASESAGVSRTW